MGNEVHVHIIDPMIDLDDNKILATDGMFQDELFQDERRISQVLIKIH